MGCEICTMMRKQLISTPVVYACCTQGGLLELLFQSTAWCQVGRGGGEWCREPSEVI